MPIFYLHVADGKLFAEDLEGQEFHDVEAARRAAIVGLRDTMAAEMKNGQINMAAFVEIENENHQLVMTVPFLDAVEVLTQHHRRPRK
jgi:predicted regulator of Ras-like GTPase activity (Roadblock/LC7/MglB family)